MPDPHDAKKDAESEARYEDDPRAEPEQWEVDERRYYGEQVYVCIVDESAGFRG
jgi:hypothetical protein